jgi:hypothetical protein
VVSFPQISLPKPCMHLSSPIRATFPTYLILELITGLIFGEELPCYIVPFRPKYSPQHPILQHTQPT